MKTAILDTNVVLDLLLFNDPKASILKSKLVAGEIKTIGSQKTIDELIDVIARPIFKQDKAQQDGILQNWLLMVSLQDDAFLSVAPWQCDDADDQIFLDLAFSFRPALLLSKDRAVLKLAKKAFGSGILISNDYDAITR